MTSWLAFGVLMLASFSKASISSNKLDNQIKQGIEKVNTSEELVKKEVEEVNREINKISLYFSRAVNESTVEGKKIYDISTQKMISSMFLHILVSCANLVQFFSPIFPSSSSRIACTRNEIDDMKRVRRDYFPVEKIIIEKFEEGIDKDKDIRDLLYLLKTMETTKNELDRRYGIFKSCLKNVLEQKSDELQKLKNVFEFTEKFSTGFYDGLRSKMKNCKDHECIKQLVQAAETKKKILTNTFKKYVKEMANLSAALQEGHRHCMSDAEKNFSEALKKFENDLKYMPTTQGTDD